MNSEHIKVLRWMRNGMSLDPNEQAALDAAIAALGGVGEPVAYLQPGTLNSAAPADFLDAKARWPEDYAGWFPVYSAPVHHVPEWGLVVPKLEVEFLRDCSDSEMCDGDLARQLASLWLAAAQPSGVPDAVREMLDEGWALDYSPDTGFIGFSHPMGGRQSLLEICKGRRDQGIGEFIVAALCRLPAPPSKEG